MHDDHDQCLLVNMVCTARAACPSSLCVLPSHRLHTSCNFVLNIRLRASAGGAQACKHIHGEQGQSVE